MKDDGSYFSRRALQERSLAASATDLRVRLLHLDLADRYETMINHLTNNQMEGHI